ncbi:MAG: hypothetical protein CMF60_01420 [Magnetococcales bacterium]|nr:hypothetical protein [Magnetococcales bacterium]|tara:strand:+ start:4648 stop:6681 length:2034 start_codon:yes stop_codon:yes gene_type:complete
MIYNAIFVLLSLGLVSLYLNKGGVAVFVGLAFLLSFIPIIKNWKGIVQRGRVKEALSSKPVLFLVLFLIVSLLSSIFGINPDYSVSKWFQILGLAVGGLFIYGALRYAKVEHFERFLLYCYWSLAVFSLWALVDHLHIIPAFTELVHGDEPRLTKYSSVLAIVIPFAIGYALLQNKLMYWVVPFLGITASVACGGRSGWLALMVMLIVLYMFYPWETVKKKRLNRHVYKLVALFAPILGLLVYKGFAGTEAFVRRATLSSPNGVGSGRLDIWSFSLQNWLDNPVLGIGVKGFRHLDFSGVSLTSHMHPHNALIEILLETGVLGLLCVVVFVFIIMTRLIKTLYANISFKSSVFHTTAICSLVGFIAYGVASLTLTSIFHAYWLSYGVVLIVLMELSRLNILRKKDDDYQDIDDNKGITAKYPVAVSIIMPCHNGEDYIVRAIESVIAQTYQNWELIVSNDGSKDRSLEIVQEYACKDKRIKVLSRDEAIGAGPARNKSIEAAQGRYIAFLDSDDMWVENKLEKQIAFMEKTGASFSGTHYFVVNEDDEVTGSIQPSKRHVSYFSMLKANDIGCLTAIYDAHQLGKMYMKKLRVAQDLQLWLDILKKQPFGAILHERLAFYRMHSASNTYSKGKSIKMRWKMIMSEPEVSLARGVYYFCFYAINGVLKSLRGRFGRRG